MRFYECLLNILPVSSSWKFCKELIQKLTEFPVISVNIRNSALHVTQWISLNIVNAQLNVSVTG